jgi:hypothetical protein
MQEDYWVHICWRLVKGEQEAATAGHTRFPFSFSDTAEKLSVRQICNIVKELHYTVTVFERLCYVCKISMLNASLFPERKPQCVENLF